MQRLPIQFAEGQKIKLFPGGQNILIKKISLKDLVFYYLHPVATQFMSEILIRN